MANEELLDERQYVLNQIEKSPIKFYYQVPFELFEDKYHVQDYRTDSQVTDRLKQFVGCGNADCDWL